LPFEPPTIAVIFDFDDTLAPDTTTLLLRRHGIDPDVFWLKDVKSMMLGGYDPTLAYLNKFLSLVGDGLPLGKLTVSDLTTFGATLDDQFYHGIPDLFEELRAIVDEYKLQIEFYMISGGLQHIIEGSKVVTKYFRAVYACELCGDTPNGPLKHIKRCVNFTEKTRYLFEINKGIDPKVSRTSPYSVNEKKDKRRTPFANMIYIGDGLTDVPSFSLVKKGIGEPGGGGTVFGVFDPKKTGSPKQALQKYLMPERVFSVHSPAYGKDEDLGSLIIACVARICSAITTGPAEAE